MAKLQIELVKMQSWGKKNGARVVAFARPTETEAGESYFQRYVKLMPTAEDKTFLNHS